MGILIVVGIILTGILFMLIAFIYMTSDKRSSRRSRIPWRNIRRHIKAGNAWDEDADGDLEYIEDAELGSVAGYFGDGEYEEDEEPEYNESLEYDRNIDNEEYSEYDRALEYDESMEYDEIFPDEDILDYNVPEPAEVMPVVKNRKYRRKDRVRRRRKGFSEVTDFHEGTVYDEEVNHSEEAVYNEEVNHSEEAVYNEEVNHSEEAVYNEEVNHNKEAVCGEEVLHNEEPEAADLPIIKIDNVSMKFKVATSTTSGLKDYMIQRLKKQITTRDLLALDGVSFDIYKGEVVGIIGTNGSGKSTLLKIVSGAMKPTGGRVLVDQSKIQLLTLGTGFDMELSARENVYLNGAIIGYPKEFINAHYDEIVAFAELEGFMDTKVKNFSSGMVSRLGFAIATVGDAAEILILDEVLSVGDEFFRKKSLKRIKEMIHSGSTVIMVSHGMGTILENCTKVVWIEKGVLQMVGDAKTVCRAYQKMEKS